MYHYFITFIECLGFSHRSVSKQSACKAGDPGSTPHVGKFPREGNGNPLQYFCLGNPMDRGAWWTMVHRVTQSRTRLKQLIMQEFVHFV